LSSINGFACFIGEGDTIPLLARALTAMSHRAWCGYLVDLGKAVYIERPKDLFKIGVEARSTIGYCLKGHLSEGSTNLIHGSLYPPDRLDTIGRLMSDGEPTQLAEALRCVDGEYAFASLHGDKVIFGRDLIGAKPLFIGRRSGLLGLASEAKALKAAGLDVEALRPGLIGAASKGVVEYFPVQALGEGDCLEPSLSEASSRILELVKRSVERRLKGRRVALGFSGGLDSSLLAHICSRLGGVKLISISTPGSRDVVEAKRAAGLLGMELIQVSLDERRVAEALPAISYLTEKAGVMDLAIGVAVNMAAAEARREGCGSLMLGQLADELFGGYMKYLHSYRVRGASATHRLMVRDILSAHSVNFERDEAAASPHSDLTLPYTSYELLKYALSLHPKLKLDPERCFRKIVLREAALKSGLPEELASRPKKALQYSSGLQRLILRCLSTAQHSASPTPDGLQLPPSYQPT